MGKLMLDLLRGTSDAKIQFNDLCNLLERFGFIFQGPPLPSGLFLLENTTSTFASLRWEKGVDSP